MNFCLHLEKLEIHLLHRKHSHLKGVHCSIYSYLRKNRRSSLKGLKRSALPAAVNWRERLKVHPPLTCTVFDPMGHPDIKGIKSYLRMYFQVDMYTDPSGNIAITTLILLGSIVIGTITGGYTAYQSYEQTGKIDWESTIISGMSGFMLSYTLGMSGYELYYNYCLYNGSTPVTNVNFSKSVGKFDLDGLPISGKITGWTKHGTQQALGRDAGAGVSNDAIVDAVKNPAQVINQTGGTTKYIGKNATVILNEEGKVVTTWANGSSGIRGGIK